MENVLIIGSGPAGYTAALYAARANLEPLCLEGELSEDILPGGQLMTTTDVENYPGYPEGVTGPQMMEDFKKQAQRYGSDVRSGRATAVDFSVRPLKVTIDDEDVIDADTVIISTGETAKNLDMEDETKYSGQGVSACETCYGFFYRKKKVAVVGGGDTACEEATYLSGLADKVYMIVRKSYLRASQVMQDRVMNNPKIEILFEHNAVGLFGDNGVEGVHLVKRMGEADEEKVDIAVDGFFLAIGHKPNTEIFKDYIELDNVGYIKTEHPYTRTNVEGVFACGDVADPIYRQAVTAAGTGCRAAMDAERYLSEKGL